MAQTLSDTEIQQRLSELSDWTLQGKEIQCVRKFNDFIEAIGFVNRLVEPAETAGHHPDITISYNKVTITLTTHDAGGLTEKDFEVAKIISQIN
jgi:4a-hydroxytetrahydrobiopterin dehydratase